ATPVTAWATTTQLPSGAELKLLLRQATSTQLPSGSTLKLLFRQVVRDIEGALRSIELARQRGEQLPRFSSTHSNLRHAGQPVVVRRDQIRILEEQAGSIQVDQGTAPCIAEQHERLAKHPTLAQRGGHHPDRDLGLVGDQHELEQLLVHHPVA